MRLKRVVDSGFTLIELLITVAILAVIAVPVGNLIISMVRNERATSDRVALSHAAQISAAYFAHDVASVGVRDYTAATTNGNLPFKTSIQLNAAYNAGGVVCGTAATPPAIVRFLSDEWNTSTPTPTVSTAVVAYYVQDTELRRLECGPSPRPEAVLAHHVDPTTLALSCSSTCTATDASGHAILPQQVRLSFAVTKPSVGAYQINLNGQRRQT
jgi:prepilin-type N-terminal cleavage/methylation domain-containing protein